MAGIFVNRFALCSYEPDNPQKESALFEKEICSTSQSHICRIIPLLSNDNHDLRGWLTFSKSYQRKNILKAKIEKHISNHSAWLQAPLQFWGIRSAVSTQTVLINSGTRSDRSFCPSIPSPHGWPQQAHSSLQGELCPGATESCVASICFMYLIHLSISLLACHCLLSAFIFARKCTPQWVFRSSPLPFPQAPHLSGPFHHLLHVVVRDLRCFLQVVDDGAVSTDHGIADTMDVTWKYYNLSRIKRSLCICSKSMPCAYSWFADVYRYLIPYTAYVYTIYTM